MSSAWSWTFSSNSTTTRCRRTSQFRGENGVLRAMLTWCTPERPSSPLLLCLGYTRIASHTPFLHRSCAQSCHDRCDVLPRHTPQHPLVCAVHRLLRRCPFHSSSPLRRQLLHAGGVTLPLLCCHPSRGQAKQS